MMFQKYNRTFHSLERYLIIIWPTRGKLEGEMVKRMSDLLGKQVGGTERTPACALDLIETD